MSVISYNPKKNEYKIKQRDNLIFVYDKYLMPPFHELKIDKIPEAVKRIDLNEDIHFRKRNENGNKKMVTMLEFELSGKYELRVTHQGKGPNEKLSHTITVNVSRATTLITNRTCVIL